MRVLLKKRSSTKTERIFSELLKKHHIPFKHSVRVEGREIDFIVGKYAIELDGHQQDSQRNAWLSALGYIPVHYSNNAIQNNLSEIERDIKQKYGIHR